MKKLVLVIVVSVCGLLAWWLLKDNMTNLAGQPADGKSVLPKQIDSSVQYSLPKANPPASELEVNSPILSNQLSRAPATEQKSEHIPAITSDELKASNKWGVTAAMVEIAHALSLSEQQSSQLSELLKRKADSEIDIVDEFMGDEFFEEEDVDPALQAEMNQLLADNQLQYQSAVNAILSEEQMQAYQAFESTKQIQEQKTMQAFAIQDLYETVPNLDDYQREEIKRFFNDHSPNEAPAKLGTFGSIYGQIAAQNYPSDALDQYLQQVLSSEQLQNYYQTISDDISF